MEESEGNSIWFGWKSSVWIGSIYSSTKQHIHKRLFNGGELVIQVMIVYGKNKKSEREDMRHELGEVKRTYGAIMGDFNEIRVANEHKHKDIYDEGADHFNADRGYKTNWITYYWGFLYLE